MDITLTDLIRKMTLRSVEVNVGHASENQVVLDDPKVSSYHAQMHLEKQGYWIMDLGSQNGTFVNEQLLAPHTPRLLHSGDMIRLGDSQLTYEASGIPQMTTALAGANQQSDGNAVYSNTNRLTAFVDSSSCPAVQPENRITGLSTSSSPGQSRNSVRVSPGSPYKTYTIGSLLEKGNRWPLVLALSVAAFVTVIAVLIFAILHSPSRTLDTFCNAEKNGDYQTYYNQLSPGLRSELSTVVPSGTTTYNSKVLSCTYSSPQVTGNSATATLTVTASSGQSIYAVTLIQDSHFDWKVDTIRLLA